MLNEQSYKEVCVSIRGIVQKDGIFHLFVGRLNFLHCLCMLNLDCYVVYPCFAIMNHVFCNLAFKPEPLLVRYKEH